MVTKSELEREAITSLTSLCLERGLDSIGDKDTLIARLLGKEKPEPEPEPPPEEPGPAPEPAPEPSPAEPGPAPEG